MVPQIHVLASRVKVNLFNADTSVFRPVFTIQLQRPGVNLPQYLARRFLLCITRQQVCFLPAKYKSQDPVLPLGTAQMVRCLEGERSQGL